MRCGVGCIREDGLDSSTFWVDGIMMWEGWGVGLISLETGVGFGRMGFGNKRRLGSIDMDVEGLNG
jgi:hypothetical protein